jgi:hypothetical protein
VGVLEAQQCRDLAVRQLQQLVNGLARVELAKDLAAVVLREFGVPAPGCKRRYVRKPVWPRGVPREILMRAYSAGNGSNQELVTMVGLPTIFPRLLGRLQSEPARHSRARSSSSIRFAVSLMVASFSATSAARSGAAFRAIMHSLSFQPLASVASILSMRASMALTVASSSVVARVSLSLE